MRPFAALSAAAVIVLLPSSGLGTGVQMFPASGELQPSTTVEFRFPSPMVGRDMLGPSNLPPVEFDPPLTGEFTWLSTRSGVFRPQGPLPLDSRWTVRLRPGLQDADGRPAGEDFSAVLKTPAFGLTFQSTGVWSDKDVPADVQVRMAFNLPVEPSAEFFTFVDAAGRRVPGVVRRAGSEDYFSLTAAQEDWNRRWQLASDPAAETEDAFAARLVAQPATPLPAGPGWRLEVAAGFPSAEGSQQLAEPVEIALGAVEPFALRTLEAGNFINSGPTLMAEFTGGLAPDITDETAQDFFKIEPSPPDLRWEASYGTVVARGAFELGRDYVFVVGDDVVSSVGQPFDGERQRTVRFAPVPPRLYLPELTISQFLGGRRVLPVRSVNLATLRVRATLLPPGNAATAMGLFAAHGLDYEFRGTPVPVTSLEGELIAEKTIPLPDPEIDRHQTTDLDWTELLGPRHAGVVLLSFEGEPLRGTGETRPAAQALLQLTDLGILWKKAGETIRVFIFSNTTAEPAADVQVELLDAEFATLASAGTDSGGEAGLTCQTAPSWLAARRGDDVCVVAMGPRASSLPIGEWFFAQWDRPAVASTQAMIFTDRPLYQPGETAHVKGFVRRDEDTSLALPGPIDAVLVLRDPGYDEVTRWSVTTDDHGAFDADFIVPAAPLGPYQLQLEMPGLEGSAFTPLLVAAYQPDAFEVDMEMPAVLPAGARGPQIRVTGQYFFGAPITDAEVRWTLNYRRAAFAPDGFGNFEFLDREADGESRPLALRGRGLITGGTPLTITPVLPTPVLAPHRGTLTAEVTDLNQQTVTRTTEFVREASDFYLGIARPEERVVTSGTEVPLAIIAVRPDGMPLADPVEVTVTVHRWRHHVVRQLGAGGAMTFHRETVEEPVLEERGRTVTVEKNGDDWTSGTQETLRFTTDAPGHHQVRVATRDTAGREVVSESWFYVAGPGETVWSYHSPYRITLVPDKELYQPGETARVLVQTPISGEAVVTLERGPHILRSMRLPLEGNAPVLEIPMNVDDGPGVDVSLVILRGADESTRRFPMPEFRYGVCRLRVDQPATRLAVEIDTPAPRVQPGDVVTTTIRVRDHRDRPVPGAGVTFYAVDDGVLALTGFERPDPADVFLRPVATRVLTGLSLADLLPEDPDDITFSNKGYLIGGGGAEGPVALRENFPGTACWMPALVTGEDGTASATFTAPDALTRYRLVAVAAAGAQAFGSAESAVTIARPLMLLPSLGAFAHSGDRLVARTVVRNETGAGGPVEVRLHTEDSTESVHMPVPEGSTRAADFTLSFLQPGEASFEWSATLHEGGTVFSDRVATNLTVRSPLLRLRGTYLTEAGEATTDLREGINPQLAEGRGQITVTVSNTRLASLGQQIRFLVGYPYGCAEQKSSALLAWVMLEDLAPLVPDFAGRLPEAPHVIDRTVAAIFDMQQPDGGLSFWPGARESVLFPSAWAAIVLNRAAENGTRLPPQWDRLLEYLAAALRGMTPETPPPLLAERTFAAYALAAAGRAEASYHEELFQRRDDLPADARAVLALAILAADGPREMVAELLDDDGSAPADGSPFGDATRERAIRLLAWTNYRPDSPEVGRLVAELLALGPQQREATTQGNAWALLSLATYRSVVEQPVGPPPAASGTIHAGTRAVSFSVDAATPVFRETFTAAPDEAITLDNPSAARLFMETAFDIAPPLGEQPAQDRGFAVSRSYRKIDDEGELQEAHDLRVGDRVVVTLRLESAQPAHFVALEDPLPAIFEAVNPAFVSRASGESAGMPGLQASHQEMRTDRVLYFCDVLPAGAHTFQYLARVRLAGEATAPAPKAEAMYRPERFGLGTVERLTSQAAQQP